MTTRQDVIAALFGQIDGLTATLVFSDSNGVNRTETLTIYATDTLFDPTQEAVLPMFSITAGPETDETSLMGFNLACTMKVDMFGFVRVGSQARIINRRSKLHAAVEAIVQAVKDLLHSQAFLSAVACTFSIVQIGPIIVEHAEREDPIGYISIPVTVEFIE